LDFNKILAALESGVQFVEQITPTLAALTPYGALAETAVKAIGAVTETVQHLQASVADGTIVAHSNDQATVRAMAQRLHDANDLRAQQIDQS
jgi:hypothetical protein